MPATNHHTYATIYTLLDAAEKEANRLLAASGSHWESIWMVLYREQAADELEAFAANHETLPTPAELGRQLFDEYQATNR